MYFSFGNISAIAEIMMLQNVLWNEVRKFSRIPLRKLLGSIQPDAAAHRALCPVPM